ncbi:MAG: hypothetical protein HDT15_05270 [Oscillibacter sp.]|nr:hypothetical protein [Oscillibacter sp.]
MEKLEITVTKMTADALRKVADMSGIPIGEVVDRYALNVAPDTPDNAFILLMEHYLICISRLSKKDSAQVFGDICGLFLGSIPPEDLDDMVASIKRTRNWEHPAAEQMTEKEREELKRSVDNMVQSMKEEYLRSVFYSLLHG